MSNLPPHSEATGVAVMTSVEKVVGELRALASSLRRPGGKDSRVTKACTGAAALIEQQAAELAEAWREADKRLATIDDLSADAGEWNRRATTAEAERDELLREKERMGAALDGVYTYCNDTLSGRADGGPDDRALQREAVIRARDLARPFARPEMESYIRARAPLSNGEPHDR